MFTLREPTPAEHRQASEAWYARIGPTLIDQWPPEVLALSMPTKFIQFPMALLDALFEPEGWPDAGIDALAAELDAAMGWRRYFVRLNSRSPKDAPWPFEVPATCSGKEALGIFAGSERVMEDLIQFKYLPEHPALICLREFVPGMRSSREFRCFVCDGVLIAVTHHDYHNPVPTPEDAGRAIREKIETWFQAELRPRLHLQTVVFDVFLDWNGGLLLIELNPYGISDPCWLGSYAAVENFSGFVAFSDPAKLGDGVGAISDEGSPATDDLNPLGGRSDSSARRQPVEPAVPIRDLLTEIARLKSRDDYPNYADYDVTLPAGHWRELAAWLQDDPKSTLHGAHTEGGEG